MIIEKLQKSILDLEIRDIHTQYPDYKINKKVEHEVLLRHQAIVFQYPIYWYSKYAILKHWFDEVFEHQFACGSKGDKLKGKNFVPSITVRTSERSYNDYKHQTSAIATYCG